jgi:hypothetical protein
LLVPVWLALAKAGDDRCARGAESSELSGHVWKHTPADGGRVSVSRKLEAQHEEQHPVGLSFDMLAHNRKRTRKIFVVIIKKDDVSTARTLNTAVARSIAVISVAVGDNDDFVAGL